MRVSMLITIKHTMNNCKNNNKHNISKYHNSNSHNISNCKYISNDTRDTYSSNNNKTINNYNA